MKEVDVKKAKWLLMAHIDFLKGGFHNGTLALQLFFTGEPLVAEECADVVSTILKLRLPSNPMVRVAGTLPLSDPLFPLFLEALHNYGFHINALVDETQIGTWIKEYYWVTIRTSSPLLMVQPNEVWYSPKGDTWEDVTMPHGNKLTFCYFDRTKSTDTTEEFFCSSKYHWQLI